MQRSKKARESRGNSQQGYKGMLAMLRRCYPKLGQSQFSSLKAKFKAFGRETGQHWKQYAVAFMTAVFNKGTSRVSPKLLMKGDIAALS